jgi:hypothetical protein
VLDPGIDDHLSSFLQPGTGDSTAVTVEPSNMGNDTFLQYFCDLFIINCGFINPAVILTLMTRWYCKCSDHSSTFFMSNFPWWPCSLGKHVLKYHIWAWIYVHLFISCYGLIINPGSSTVCQNESQKLCLRLKCLNCESERSYSTYFGVSVFTHKERLAYIMRWLSIYEATAVPPFVTSYSLEISCLWRLFHAYSGHWFVSPWWTLCRPTSNFLLTSSLCLTQPGSITRSLITSQQCPTYYYFYWHITGEEYCRRFKGTSVFLISQLVFWASRELEWCMHWPCWHPTPFDSLEGSLDFQMGWEAHVGQVTIPSCSWPIPVTIIIQLSTVSVHTMST